MKNHFFDLVGVGAAQMPSTELVFAKIIKDFDLIIEIGTDNGGFSIWLHRNKRPDALFLTYEMDPSHVKIPKNHEVNDCIRYCDCFNPDVIDSISALIKARGKTLFLCDGGAKAKEFSVFSKLLKAGDVIMMHDFADSPHESENYRSVKSKLLSAGLWDGAGFEVHESSLGMVESCLNLDGLEKYKYQDFLNVLWGSFIKL